ncbi:MAG: efflux RND transporter periplasmic adaptor subunit [Desulfobacterales bacterium]|jgi:HlyD family secretion protein|nr:efflux RND transporter periplasmic adaptor subunit [Desulfobacterales bacterium]
MKKWLRLMMVLVLILAGGRIGFNYLKGQNKAGPLRVSGNIEVTDAQMSFRIPGRLEKRLVDEGDRVAKGQLIATLEKTDQEIAVAAAAANLAHAQAVLSELEAGSRPAEIERSFANMLQAKALLAELTNGSRKQEIESARAERARAAALVKTAEVQLDQAKADYHRYKDLFKDGGVSQEQYELVRTRYESAKNAENEALAVLKSASEGLSLRVEGPRQEQIDNARAALKAAEAQYSLVKEGPRKEKISQAAAEAKAAEERLNQAKQQLAYTELFSPMAGRVLSKSAEPGEYLNPAAPVVLIGDIHHPWLRAYINEKDIGRIHLNDPATLTTDSFPGKTYSGRVSFIGSQAEFTPKAVQTFEERVKLMFRIKIEVENSAEDLKPGMPADAEISLTASSARD